MTKTQAQHPFFVTDAISAPGHLGIAGGMAGRKFAGMDLVELKVEIPSGSSDATDSVMLELGVEGWTLLEDAIAKRAWVVGIFPSGVEAKSRWAELKPMLPEPPVGGETLRVLADADWRDSYKAHFKAWRFGSLHWAPIWEKGTYVVPSGDAVLWLDPGLAFGTGNHETTRLCVERLVEWGKGDSGFEKRRKEAAVIDAGCGSGILALSAVKLGFENVVGFDNDPEAVRVSQENADMNKLGGTVPFFTGDLVTGLAGRTADIVLANILANVLIQFSRELVAAVAPGGVLVLSGILATENAQVREAFARVAPGWEVDHRVMGDWSDLMLKRPDRFGQSVEVEMREN